MIVVIYIVYYYQGIQYNLKGLFIIILNSLSGYNVKSYVLLYSDSLGMMIFNRFFFCGGLKFFLLVKLEFIYFFKKKREKKEEEYYEF